MQCDADPANEHDAISAGLARLSKNGTSAVRMMWMINVWVKSDSTNYPVWNSAGLSQALNA
jgi:hypothetical protein